VLFRSLNHGKIFGNHQRPKVGKYEIGRTLMPQEEQEKKLQLSDTLPQLTNGKKGVATIVDIVLFPLGAAFEQQTQILGDTIDRLTRPTQGYVVGKSLQDDPTLAERADENAIYIIETKY
jgi:hypothetical protein